MQAHASTDFTNNQPALSLLQGASHWYLLVNQPGNSPVEASFNSAQAIDLEQPRNGTIADQSSADYYTLNLTQDQNIDLDFASLANPLQVRVTGAGVDTTFNLFDEASSNLLSLSKGQYRIQIASSPRSLSNNTDYHFTVHNLDTAAKLALDADQPLTLSAGQSLIQQVQGQAGQHLYFNAGSGNSGAANWTLQNISGTCSAEAATTPAAHLMHCPLPAPIIWSGQPAQTRR